MLLWCVISRRTRQLGRASFDVPVRIFLSSSKASYLQRRSHYCVAYAMLRSHGLHGKEAVIAGLWFKVRRKCQEAGNLFEDQGGATDRYCFWVSFASGIRGQLARASCDVPLLVYKRGGGGGVV